MTAITAPSAPPELPDDAGPTDGSAPTWRRVLRFAAMPVFIGLVLLALYLWVDARELDPLEARRLTPDIIRTQTLRHIELTLISTVFVLLLAVPAGIAITRPGPLRRLAPAIIGLGNAGQAIPSLGLLGLIYAYAVMPDSIIPRGGLTPAVMALVAYSFLPILRNTMVGLERVDRSVLEAARGMGMSNAEVLRRVELPLAVPVILAGIRTALVLNVGSATIVFAVGSGGLGLLIFQGFSTQRLGLLVVGAVLVASLALLIDYLAGIVEELATPRGL